MNSTIYRIDFETFSEADLTEVGAYRYAFDLSTEILCAAIARNNERPVVWRQDGCYPSTTEFMQVNELLDEITHPSAIIYAFSAQFEIALSAALWQKTFGKPAPQITQWRCTQVMARRAGIQSSLAKSAEYLGLTEQKDKRGKDLIKVFSMMQKATKETKKKAALPVRRIHPKDDPEAFNEFCEYCRQDVVVEGKVHEALHLFELKGMMLEAFHMDARLNQRGFPVNLDALHKAQALIEPEEVKLSAEFYQLTGLNPTQTKKLLPWLQEHGYKGTNMRAETFEEMFDGEESEDAIMEVLMTSGMDELGVKALLAKQKLSFASIKKIKKMIECVGPHDNKVRGTHVFAGARTMRWTAEKVQPQNFKRATVKNTEEIYRDICKGMDGETVGIVHGPVLEALGNCVRHFIHDKSLEYVDNIWDGEVYHERPFLDADYSAIEARVVCWLANQEDALQRFRDKVDSYIAMAAVIYDRSVVAITAGYKADEQESVMQRWVGKQTILGCGYSMGASKFMAQCKKYGVDVSVELAEKSVMAYRKTHNKVRDLWYATERAFKNAINNVGTKYTAGKLTCFCLMVHGKKFGFIKLPSGRSIAYPEPRIVDDQIQYWSQKTKAVWGFIDTYGARLVENATQGVAADFMMHGAVTAERAGYEPAALIHDEFLSYKHDGGSVAGLVECMTLLPAWAAGMPLAAEGKEIPFYKK